MKLNADQIKILAHLAALFPGDVLIDTATALGEVPEVPAFRAALARRVMEGAKMFDDFAKTLSGSIIQVVPPVQDERTAPQRIASWLQAHPGQHSPGEVRAALEMPPGTFGEALKHLRDAGTILAEGQGAGRKIQAKP